MCIRDSRDRVALGVEAACGFALQGCEISRFATRAPAHRLFEIAPRQQENQQHDGGIEMGVAG